MKYFVKILRIIGLVQFLVITPYGAAQTMTKTDRYESKRFGIGPVISTVPGLGLYGQVNRADFVKADLAYDQNDYFDVSVDYGVGYPDAFDTDGAIVPYWGVGATVVGQDDSDEVDSGAVGMRIPLGVNIHVARTPLMATFEATPTVLAVPSTDSYLRASAALKVMF